MRSKLDLLAVHADECISRYGSRIGLFGGVDTDRLCRMGPDELYEYA